MQLFFGHFVFKHAVQQAGKFAMQPFIATDQFITKRKTRRQPTLLHPENGAEASAEEYSFYGCKGNKTFCKAAILYPAKSPFCFFLYSRHCVNSMKKTIFFFGILDIGVNQ